MKREGGSVKGAWFLVLWLKRKELKSSFVERGGRRRAENGRHWAEMGGGGRTAECSSGGNCGAAGGDRRQWVKICHVKVEREWFEKCSGFFSFIFSKFILGSRAIFLQRSVSPKHKFALYFLGICPPTIHLHQLVYLFY